MSVAWQRLGHLPCARVFEPSPTRLCRRTTPSLELIILTPARWHREVGSFYSYYFSLFRYEIIKYLLAEGLLAMTRKPGVRRGQIEVLLLRGMVWLPGPLILSTSIFGFLLDRYECCLRKTRFALNRTLNRNGSQCRVRRFSRRRSFLPLFSFRTNS